MDCIFCMLANGQIPTATLYEDEDFRVILDSNPGRRGHALILPKEHYANLFEMPDDLAAKALKVAKKVGPALMKAVGAQGLQLVQNNGEAGGQTVFHFHMHLIPGYDDIGPGAQWEPAPINEEDKNTIPELVKQYL